MNVVDTAPNKVGNFIWSCVELKAISPALILPKHHRLIVTADPAYIVCAACSHFYTIIHQRITLDSYIFYSFDIPFDNRNNLQLN